MRKLKYDDHGDNDRDLGRTQMVSRKRGRGRLKWRRTQDVEDVGGSWKDHKLRWFLKEEGSTKLKVGTGHWRWHKNVLKMPGVATRRPSASKLLPDESVRIHLGPFSNRLPVLVSGHLYYYSFMLNIKTAVDVQGASPPDTRRLWFMKIFTTSLFGLILFVPQFLAKLIGSCITQVSTIFTNWTPNHNSCHSFTYTVLFSSFAFPMILHLICIKNTLHAKCV